MYIRQLTLDKVAPTNAMRGSIVMTTRAIFQLTEKAMIYPVMKVLK